MAPRVHKAFLLMALAAFLYRQADVASMQLEDADEFNGEEVEPEAASFSEMDADELADKLDANDEEAAVGEDEEELNEDEYQDGADPEPQSFFEGEEGEEEVNEEDFDLSQMSDEEAAAVMEMLSPEEQKAFQDMLAEHRNGDVTRDAEL